MADHQDFNATELLDIFHEWEEGGEPPRNVDRLAKETRVDPSVVCRLLNGKRIPKGPKSQTAWNAIKGYLRQQLTYKKLGPIPAPRDGDLRSRMDYDSYLMLRNSIERACREPNAADALRMMSAFAADALRAPSVYGLMGCRNTLNLAHLKLQEGFETDELTPLTETLVEDSVQITELLVRHCDQCSPPPGDPNLAEEARNYFGNAQFFGGARLRRRDRQDAGVKAGVTSLARQAKSGKPLDDWQLNNVMDCVEYGLRHTPRRARRWADQLAKVCVKFPDDVLAMAFYRDERPLGYPRLLKAWSRRGAPVTDLTEKLPAIKQISAFAKPGVWMVAVLCLSTALLGRFVEPSSRGNIDCTAASASQLEESLSGGSINSLVACWQMEPGGSIK